MDWKFITHHLASGYIIVMATLTLYFIVLRVIGKKQAIGRIIAIFVFSFYLVGVLTVTGICIKASFSPQIVYIPFVDMITGPVDTVLNIIMFIPMGIFLPMLYKKYDRFANIAFAGFLMSLSIEIVQMFGFGTTDINDLITNTVGACLGYAVFRGLHKFFPKSWISQVQADDSRFYYEPVLIWVMSLLIMIAIQPQICNVLFPVNMTYSEMHTW